MAVNDAVRPRVDDRATLRLALPYPGGKTRSDACSPRSKASSNAGHDVQQQATELFNCNES